MIHSHLFSLAKDNVPLLKEWGQLLMTTHRAEAMETLQEENSTAEAMYLITAAHDQHFVLAVSQFAGQKKSTNMQRELNRKHREMIAHLKELPAGELPDLRGATLEILYNLQT